MRSDEECFVYSCQGRVRDLDLARVFPRNEIEVGKALTKVTRLLVLASTSSEDAKETEREMERDVSFYARASISEGLVLRFG